MTRSGHLLSAALLCVAAAAGAVAAVAFVFPSSGAPRTPPHSREAALAQLPSLEVGVSELLPASLASEETFSHASSFLRWVGAGLIAGMVVAASSAPASADQTNGGQAYGNPQAYRSLPGQYPKRAEVKKIKWGPGYLFSKDAPYLNLCKDNKRFKKTIKDQLYKIQQRQKKYPEGSVVYNRFVKKIEQTNMREKSYGDRYCGKEDGLPRVIATGEPVARGGVLAPAFIFLYIAGWIGWAGRSYLIRTQDEMKELNIDVPLALTCMTSGFAWPVAAWQEIVNGEMVVSDEDIHRSNF